LVADGLLALALQSLLLLLVCWRPAAAAAAAAGCPVSRLFPGLSVAAVQAPEGSWLPVGTLVLCPQVQQQLQQQWQAALTVQLVLSWRPD
jgi:hypothetical protein